MDRLSSPARAGGAAHRSGRMKGVILHDLWVENLLSASAPIATGWYYQLPGGNRMACAPISGPARVGVLAETRSRPQRGILEPRVLRPPVTCRAELLRRLVAQRAVRPDRVVLPAVPRPLRPRVGHRLELDP